MNWAVTGKAVSNQFESGKWATLFGGVVDAVTGYWKEGLSGAACQELTKAIRTIEKTDHNAVC